MTFTAEKVDDCGLWLGDIGAAEDSPALDGHGITHVVSILDYEPTNISKNRTHLHVFADDLESTDLITNEFEKCFQFIDQSIERGHQVLVHCHAGISRSATIVAMYLMRKYSLTREQALQRLISRRQRAPVMPNYGFVRQLDLYHRMNYKVDVENELYKEFQRTRFDATPFLSFVDGTQSFIVLLDDDSGREYQCRSCHFKLFTCKDVQRHETESRALCNDTERVFTYYLDWIDAIFVDSTSSINCPNCKTSVGEYALEGVRCKCRQWIKPAFVFRSESIE